MAEMTIRLKCDPITGKKDIIIDLRSDEDALPVEHEQLHSQLVEKLIEGGTLKAGEVGKVVVERVEDEKQPAAPVENTPEPQREAQTEGN